MIKPVPRNHPSSSAKLVFLALNCLWGPGVAFLATENFDPYADVLQSELWTSFEPLSPQEVQKPLTKSELIQEVLQECQVYFSGMVYGWKFFYRPYDKNKAVQEILEVTPLGQIPPSSKRLSVKSVRASAKEDRLYCQFLYRLPDFEIQRRKAWASANSLSIGGQAEVPVGPRQETRRKALQQAFKQALRSYLRPRWLNKPFEVHGEALLQTSPFVIIKAGNVVCKASFWLKQLSVRPYQAY